MFNYKKYESNIKWGEALIRAREFELAQAKKNLSDYVDWWDRFINYCQTGEYK